MQELTFLVKGSATEPYEIIFIKDGDSLTAVCNCPAGTYGNLCKHRVNILDGKTTSITSDNADQVATVVGWLVGTDVAAALDQLRQLEQTGDADKNALNEAKRKVARIMNT
jgi:uncharacterized Zn finger protein